MNDIFISYDRNDRLRAQKFADALEAAGWSVWWDREIPLGESFDQVIEQELNAARCVVVLWSTESVQSNWVKTEASSAADRDCLVPVFIDRVPSPLEFRRIQSAELWDWNGDPADPEFERLLQAVRQLAPVGPAISVVARPLSTASKPQGRAKGKPLRAIGALALIIAAIFFATFAVQKIRTAGGSIAGTGSDTSPPINPSTAPPVSPAAGDAARAVPPINAFSIKVGEKIDDGVPGPGAGIIQMPYEHDQYVFEAKAGQNVYFRILRYSTGMSYIKWRLVDENGMELFNVCLGCSEPGVQRLLRGGMYTLTVGADNDASTGSYQLQLYDVPTPGKFTLRIGDAIEENKPGAGAGVIESPGSEDVYTFTAAPRQAVYFRMLEHSTGMSYIKWRLTDDNGMELFNNCLGCSEPGAQTLIKGGSYVLTVGHKTDPLTGEYRLQLYNVPVQDHFTIKPGDRIRPGVPGAGAGAIESPGAEDVYAFNASAGQRFTFQMLEHSKGTDYLTWRLEDENGMKVFDACLACAEPGVQTLTRGGKYTLTVGSRTNPSTGTYTFNIGLNSP